MIAFRVYWNSYLDLPPPPKGLIPLVDYLPTVGEPRVDYRFVRVTHANFLMFYNESLAMQFKLELDTLDIRKVDVLDPEELKMLQIVIEQGRYTTIT